MANGNSVEIDHLIHGLTRYFVDHLETGSFLRAVLENDLRGACARAADQGTRSALADVVTYIELMAPAECWGSPEKVKAWLDFEPCTQWNTRKR
jgi:hypothetical protein